MKWFRHIPRLLAICFFLIPLAAHAGYRIQHDFCSPVGGPWQSEGGATLIASSHMRPCSDPIQQDLDVLHARGQDRLATGSAKLNAMSLYNCADVTCGGNAKLAALLADKALNYFTAGFTPEYNDGLTALREAVRTYAYLYNQGYSGALSHLKTAFNDFMSIHLVFADEFLVDALHLRFSNMTWTMDACLDGQIALLANAIEYYQAGIRDFLSLAMTPIVGSQDIVANVLGADEWHLFGVLAERQSLAIRERGAKMRAMGKQTDSFIQEDLSKSLSGLYIQAAALAQKMGEDAFTHSAQFLLTAMGGLGKQVDDYKRGLNPLGYDDRYIPLMTFESLKDSATGKSNACLIKEQDILNEQRAFDQKLADYEYQLFQLNVDYKSRLNSLTGCVISDEAFGECVDSAGDTLFLDCPLSLDVDAFDACMVALGSLGVLGDKYRQIKAADIRLSLARLQHDNMAKRIENHNASVNYQIQLKKDEYAQHMEALDVYQKKLENACTINKTYTNNKKRINGKWVRVDKLRRTEKTFTVKNSQLVAQTANERDVAEATLHYAILNAQDLTVVENMLLDQAEALVGIDAAVHNLNNLIASFDLSLKEKESTKILWEQSKTALAKYGTQNVAIQRILLSNAVISHGRDLNELAHYSYLTAKALEYRYAKKLEGIFLGLDKYLNLTDLYKCQSATDFDDFLKNLSDYNDLWCKQPWTFGMERFYFSVAFHILGLTNKALGDSNNDNKVDATGKSVLDVRYQKFQEFVNQNKDAAGNLTFSFSTNINAYPLKDRMNNIKIWHGAIPCSNGGEQAKGLTASLFFRGNPGAIQHQMVITQKGGHALLKDDETLDYYPVNTHTLLTGDSSEPLATQVPIFPFTEVDLSMPGSTGTGGTWATKFTNKSAAVQEWVITLNLKSTNPYQYPDMPFHKLEDIYFYFDGIGEY